MSVLLTLIVVVALALDMQNVLARWVGSTEMTDDESDDYTILIPLYTSPKYFKNSRELGEYRDNALLVVDISVPAMACFADEVEAAGWRVHRCDAAPSPAALVREGLAAVDTTWTIRMDGDAWFEDSPARAIAAAARAGADVCSVKVVPANRRTIAECLQGVEYDTAMLGRHLRPWLTSGACIVARTEALQHVLERHSLWFLGEDIETGLIARHDRMRVRHLGCRVYTQVPTTFRALARQRRAWWAGSFRQTWINFEHGLREPIGLLYAAGLVWVLLLAKAGTFAHALGLVPLIAVLYTAVTLAANWSVRSRWMILYPYYALVQTLVMPPLGVVEYIRVAWRSRRLGRFEIGFRRGHWLPTPQPESERSDSASRRWNLGTLERLTGTVSSAERLHELRFTLVHLRGYADLDGWLPAAFHELVVQTFPEAVERRTLPAPA